MRNLPSLTAVRVFEAAARHENFTRAAAELGMTQAAVSYQIRLLEERLGMSLFTRSRQRVRLTEAGRRIAPPIGSAFDTIADAFASLIEKDAAVLTLSSTHTFASNWLAPRLGAFQVQRPELAVRLKADNQMTDFASDEVDIAIRSGHGCWPGLRCHFLFHLHSTPMCSPAFLAAHPIATPADLLNVPRISGGDPWWRAWLERAGVAVSDDGPAPGIWLDSQVIEGSTAMRGDGVAMLSPIFWRSELAAGQLVAPFPLIMPDMVYYWLVYPEHTRNRPKIKAFRDWLLAEVARDSRDGPPEAYTPPGETPST